MDCTWCSAGQMWLDFLISLYSFGFCLCLWFLFHTVRLSLHCKEVFREEIKMLLCYYKASDKTLNMRMWESWRFEMESSTLDSLLFHLSSSFLGETTISYKFECKVFTQSLPVELFIWTCIYLREQCQKSRKLIKGGHFFIKLTL